MTVEGKFLSKTFPLETPLTVMKDWRERRRAEAKYGIAASADRTFKEDAEAYLALCEGMPTYRDRQYRIGQWIEAFGHRPRAKITSADIRAELAKWRKTGRWDGGPLSPGSLNQRRTALMALYTALDGRGAVNPVKDVPAEDERPVADQWRARPLREWYRLLARLKKGSKTRARLRVMLWTGWPHQQIMQLTPDDLDLTHARARVSRRRKGKGAAARWLPLLPHAVTALRAFAAADAWGRFSQSAMHSMLQRAWRQENAWRKRWNHSPLRPIRPYDARHQFGHLIAQQSDERALQELLLHGTPQQSRRYSDGATTDRLVRALQVLQVQGAKIGDQAGRTHAKRRPPRPRKSAKNRSKTA